MLEVQKETYLNVIISNSYSDDAFSAKSITLDFLFGCDNPYTAIVSLNECLNENNRLAKMGLNCIYGIMLAVKEYKEFYQSVIVYEFVETLINVLIYKISDVSIKNYNLCMEKILEFILENIDFRLIISFFELANSFSYCEDDNDQIKEVFKKYCDVLDSACKELMKRDSKLLCYNLLSIKEELSEKKFSESNILARVNNIVCNIYEKYKNELLIVSNLEDDTNKWANNIQKEHIQIRVSIVDRENITSIQQVYNLKVLFLIDFDHDNFDELIYLFGVMEGKLEQNQLLGCFFHSEKVNSKLIYKSLIDRYACEDNFNDRLINFLKEMR